MASYKGFIYSDTRYQLKEFVQMFWHRFPVLFIVREGILGTDDLHTLAQYEIFRAVELKYQSRVLCRDSSGQRVSIPRTYGGHVFQTLDRGEGFKPRQIGQLIEDWVRNGKALSDLHFTVHGDEKLTYSIVGEMEAFCSLGRLQYLDTYDEPYVAALSVIPDCVSTKISLIPNYIMREVSIVTGVEGEDQSTFAKLLYCDVPGMKTNIAQAGMNEGIIVFPSQATKAPTFVHPLPAKFIHSYTKAATMALQSNLRAKPYVVDDLVFLKVSDNKSKQANREGLSKTPIGIDWSYVTKRFGELKTSDEKMVPQTEVDNHQQPSGTVPHPQCDFRAPKTWKQDPNPTRARLYPCFWLEELEVQRLSSAECSPVQPEASARKARRSSGARRVKLCRRLGQLKLVEKWRSWGKRVFPNLGFGVKSKARRVNRQSVHRQEQRKTSQRKTPLCTLRKSRSAGNINYNTCAQVRRTSLPTGQESCFALGDAIERSPYKGASRISGCSGALVTRSCDVLDKIGNGDSGYMDMIFRSGRSCRDNRKNGGVSCSKQVTKVTKPGEQEEDEPRYDNMVFRKKTVPHFNSLDEVSADLSALSTQEVIECLHLLRMREYAGVFRQNDVDGTMLQDLDEAMLVEDFKLKRFHARKLVKFIHGWRPLRS